MKIREKVYMIVSSIPKGRVMTYGQVAKQTGIRSARAVGQILHRNTDSLHIPCHRVVFADGSLSKHYVFGGEKEQKRKLEEEGVDFIGDKVNLSISLRGEK